MKQKYEDATHGDSSEGTDHLMLGPSTEELVRAHNQSGIDQDEFVSYFDNQGLNKEESDSGEEHSIPDVLTLMK